MVQASILVLVPAFQFFRIISFHCYTVLLTVIATLLQTEAGKFVLAFFFFRNGLWEPPMLCPWCFIGRKLVQIAFLHVGLQ